MNRSKMMAAVKNYNKAAKNMNKAMDKLRAGGVIDYMNKMYAMGGHVNPMAGMFSNPPSILNQQHSPIDGIYPLEASPRIQLAQKGGNTPQQKSFSTYKSVNKAKNAAKNADAAYNRLKSQSNFDEDKYKNMSYEELLKEPKIMQILYNGLRENQDMYETAMDNIPADNRDILYNAGYPIYPGIGGPSRYSTIDHNKAENQFRGPVGFKSGVINWANPGQPQFQMGGEATMQEQGMPMQGAPQGNEEQLMSLAQSLVMGDQEAMAIYEDLAPQDQEIVNQMVQQMQQQQPQQGTGNPSTDRMNELAGTIGAPMMRRGGYTMYKYGGKKMC